MKSPEEWLTEALEQRLNAIERRLEKLSDLETKLKESEDYNKLLRKTAMRANLKNGF